MNIILNKLNSIQLNKIFSKTLIILMLLFTVSVLFNNVFATYSPVYSPSTTTLPTISTSGTSTTGSTLTSTADPDTFGDEIEKIFGALFSSLYGIVGTIFSLLVLLIPSIVLIVLNLVLGLFVDGALFTPDKVFMNKVNITNIMLYVDGTVREDSGLVEFALTISAWFRVFFLFSLAMLLGVLVYLAIKTLLSSMGAQKADIKQMLTNWLVSLFILFGLSIIIVGSITLSDIFVRIISNALTNSSVDYFGKVYSSVFANLFHFSNPIQVITSMVIIGVITVQTFKYFFAYIYRMIKVGFLIIIAPFIAVTYSLDKSGDNKAQAFSKWMGEFLSTVFIQPIHLLIYSLLIGAASTAANGHYSYLEGVPGMSWIVSANPTFFIVAYVALKSMDKIEKLILGMFKLSGSSSVEDGSALLKFATFGALYQTGSKIYKSYKESDENRGSIGKVRNLDSKKEPLEPKGPEEPNPTPAPEGPVPPPPIEPKDDDIPLEGVETLDNPEVKNDTQEIPKVINEEKPKEPEEEPKKKRRFARARSLIGDSDTRGKAGKFMVSTWAGMTSMALGSGKDGYGGGLAGLATGFAASSGAFTYAEKRKKEKRKKQGFEIEANETADSLVKDAMTYAHAMGIDLDPKTKEGQKMLAQLMAKVKAFSDSKDMQKELDASLKNYRKFLQDKRGMTKTQASRTVDQIRQSILNGSYTQGEDTSEEEEYYVQNQVIANMSYDREKLKTKYKEYTEVEDRLNDLVREKFSSSPYIELDSPTPSPNDRPKLPPPKERSGSPNPTVREMNGANRRLNNISEIYDAIFTDSAKFQAFVREAERRGIKPSEVLAYKNNADQEIVGIASRLPEFMREHNGSEEFKSEYTDFNSRSAIAVNNRSSKVSNTIRQSLESMVPENERIDKPSRESREMIEQIASEIKDIKS